MGGRIACFLVSTIYFNLLLFLFFSVEGANDGDDDLGDEFEPDQDGMLFAFFFLSLCRQVYVHVMNRVMFFSLFFLVPNFRLLRSVEDMIKALPRPFTKKCIQALLDNLPCMRAEHKNNPQMVRC